MVVVRVVAATINLIMKGVDKEWEIDEAKNDLDWRNGTYVGISTIRLALLLIATILSSLALHDGASRHNNNGSKHGIFIADHQGGGVIAVSPRQLFPCPRQTPPLKITSPELD